MSEKFALYRVIEQQLLDIQEAYPDEPQSEEDLLAEQLAEIWYDLDEAEKIVLNREQKKRLDQRDALKTRNGSQSYDFSKSVFQAWSWGFLIEVRPLFEKESIRNQPYVLRHTDLFKLEKV